MKVSADLFDSNIGFENSFYRLVLQPDLEEAKGLEIHNSLKSIQAKLDQTYAFLTKEGEFAHETIEASASVNAAREISALQEANYKLQNQVEELQKRVKTELEEAKGEEIMKLQNSVQAMQTKVDETNALLIKERESAQKAIEKASIIVRETGEIHVKDMEKIEKLSAEVEELKKLLEAERNRANESEKKCIEALETGEIKEQKPGETVNNRLEEKPTNINSKNKVLRRQALTMAQFTKLQKQQEYQELLNRCITQQPRFSKGLPIAAFHIYKCLRQGRAFEGEKTSIFYRIIQTIGQAIEAQEKNNNVLAYWLSTASILLVVLQQTLGQDEVNSPIFLFKQQLTAYVEKIYGMIRDNLKGEIFPLLKLCIQAPKLSTVHFLLMERDERDVSLWQEIVNKMDSFLNLLKSNHVSPFLVRKIFMQTFYFINGQLFNSVLLRRECCTFNNGEYFKAGLSEMEHWCYKATEEYAGSAWDELKHTRQAIGFLVIHQKDKKTLDEISHDLCPLISIQQLHHISTTFLDDKYGTYSLSTDVISKMEVLMTEDSDNERSIPPLLLNDTSKPLSFDGLFESMDQINIEDVEPPPLICDNLGFGFLPRDES